MTDSICGIDCSSCGFKDTCRGCVKTGGSPYNGGCVVAGCCKDRGYGSCGECTDKNCALKAQLIKEFNSLGIEEMPQVTELNMLRGSYINLEYTFPSGQTAKLLDDNKIYLGNQLCREKDSGCYGIAADENLLLVCRYGEGGSDAEIIVYKKRKP